jgi:hypothetical protein
MNSIDFEQWLSISSNFRCHLVEIDYLEEGELKTLYLSNASFQSVATDTPPHMPYNDVIIDDIKLGQRLDEIFYGRTSTIRSTIKFLSTEFVNNLLSLDVEGQQVRIYLGDPSWPKSDFKLIGQWYSEDIEPDGNNYSIPLLDASHALDVSVCSTYENGTAEGKSIPRVFGTVFNAEPVLIDELGDGTYQINDGPITSLTVFDGGLSVSANIDYATGIFTLNTQAQGRITCNVTQADNTCFNIVNSLLIESEITAKENTFSDVPTYEMGAYINDTTTRRDLIDDACVSAGFAWCINSNGEFKAVKYNGLTGVGIALLTDDDIDADSFKVKRRVLSVPSVNVHYAKNYTVQSDGLFGAVSTANRDLLSKEYSVVSATNADVATKHPSYPDINAYTLLVQKADAQTEADRRAALNTKIRKVFTMQAYGAAVNFQVGDELNSEFAQNLGDTCLVLAVEAVPASSLAVIEVM